MHTLTSSFVGLFVTFKDVSMTKKVKKSKEKRYLPIRAVVSGGIKTLHVLVLL